MDSRKESLDDFSPEEYQKYRLLMHKIARRHYGILLHTDFPEEYEDVYQNVIISFLQAKKSYNPETGYKFTTYAMASADKNLSTLLNKQKKRVSAVSLELIKSKDEDVSYWQEIIADKTNDGYKPSIEVRLKEAVSKIKRLSPAAKLVVRELLAPSEEIQKAHKDKLEYAKKAKEMGNPSPSVKQDIDYRFIFQYYKVKTKKRKEIYDEIREVFEL